MAITFNTRQAVQKLRDRGASESLADGIVEVVEEATDELVTRDVLRAEINRALLIFGGIIIGAMGTIAAIALAIAELT